VRSFLWVICLLCVGAVLSAVVLLLPREIHMRVATSDPPAREASAVTAGETSATGASNQPQASNARSDAATAVPRPADEAKATDRLAPPPTAAAGTPPNLPEATAKAAPKAQGKAPAAPSATATATAPPPGQPEVRLPASKSMPQSSLEPVRTTAAPPTEPTAAPSVVVKSTPSIAPPVEAPSPSAPAGATPLVAALTPAPREDAPPTPTVPGPKPPQAAPNETVSREPTKLSAPEIDALVARGDALISVADVVSARLFYERAAEAGDGPAALRLGETYDPQFLAWARLGRVRGDPAMAVHWYKRAHELGVSAAEILLNRAESK